MLHGLKLTSLIFVVIDELRFTIPLGPYFLLLLNTILRIKQLFNLL